MNTPKRPKRPRDPNQLAHQVFLESIGERPPAATPESPVQPIVAAPPKPAPVSEPAAELPEKNQHAVALSRLGASKGGQARTQGMTPEERRELARKAARARWGKKVE
jgi:hypothetical protein